MGARLPEASRRQVFAERFALLYAEAGDPPLKRVAQSVTRTGRPDELGRPVRLSVQRLSDWRRGQNVPARFTALEMVLTILIGLARRNSPHPRAEGLYDLEEWRILWKDALASPAMAADSFVEGDTSARAVDSSVCPYRGLAAFRQEDAAYFLGREASIASLVARLKLVARTGGIVALVGASGAGKSSLLHAGLIPALAIDGLSGEGPHRGPTVIMSPSENPVEELMTRLLWVTELVNRAAWTGPTHSVAGSARANKNEEAEVLDEVYDAEARQRAAGLRAAIRAYAEREAGPDARLILIVDQFEELFTLCDDEYQKNCFIQMLHVACTPDDVGSIAPALVVLGVRADFYDRCLDYPELAEALQDRQMVLGPMSAAELREAVAGPAKAVGLRLEIGLLELILRDAGIRASHSRAHSGQSTYDAGVLPLLSHALRATWQQRRAGRLSIAAYRATGGIHGSVESVAERAWGQLDRDGQAAALQLLLKLTRIGEDTQDTRRHCNKHELLEHTGNRTAAKNALEVLVKARLVTLDAERAQITHEALLQAWPRLRGWIDQHRAGLLLRQRVEEDAADWEGQHRDPSLLYLGARLEAAQQWAKTADPDGPSELALAFLAASTRQRQRRRWGIRAAVAVVMVLALVAGIAAVIARSQRDQAIFAGVLAEADRLQDADPSLSAQLDLVAHRMRPDDPEVVGRILSTQNVPLAHPLHGDSGAVYDTAFSPDGHLLATASEGRTVQLWKLTNSTRPTPLGRPLNAGSSWVSAARFSPDGRILASSDGDGTVHLWNVTDPATPTPLTPPLSSGGSSISQLAFSVDGRTLATATDDTTVRLWNLSDPAHPVLGPALTGHTQVVRSVAFSPDGHLLAAGSDDNTALMWDITNPDHPVLVGPALTGHSDAVQSLAFSPDNRTLATASVDKTARLWNVTDPNHPLPIGPPLAGHGGRIWSVAFSPDGGTLATGSADGTAKLWNLSNPANPAPIGGSLGTRTGGITSLAFSPDGRTVATGGQDGTTLLWSIPRTVLLGHRSQVKAAAFGPDGRILATAGNTIRLWNVANPANPSPINVPIAGAKGYIGGLAFGPHRHLLAAASSDGAVRLWNVADPGHPFQTGPAIADHAQYANVVAFSPDDTVLATASTDDAAQLWNVADPAHPVPIGTPLRVGQGYISSLTFSPNGRTLAITTANSDGSISLWDVTNPSSAVLLGPPLQPHAGQIVQAAFSSDGQTLATTEDKDVRLWNVTDPVHPKSLHILTGHTQMTYAVAFSPDGHTLVSGGVDKTLRLWDLSQLSRPTASAGPITGHTGIIKPAVFAPDGHTLATASDDGTVMLWDLNIDDSIQRICTTTHGIMSPEQWQRTVRNLPYNPPC